MSKYGFSSLSLSLHGDSTLCTKTRSRSSVCCDTAAAAARLLVRVVLNHQVSFTTGNGIYVRDMGLVRSKIPY